MLVRCDDALWICAEGKCTPNHKTALSIMPCHFFPASVIKQRQHRLKDDNRENKRFCKHSPPRCTPFSVGPLPTHHWLCSTRSFVNWLSMSDVYTSMELSRPFRWGYCKKTPQPSWTQLLCNCIDSCVAMPINTQPRSLSILTSFLSIPTFEFWNNVTDCWSTGQFGILVNFKEEVVTEY